LEVRPTRRWRELDSNFRFLEDTAALVVQLDPAVSGEFHRILIASIQDLRLGTRLQTDNSVTWPFLSILVAWTALLFFGFGLLARLNAAVVFTLAIGALSVARCNLPDPRAECPLQRNAPPARNPDSSGDRRSWQIAGRQRNGRTSRPGL
jgi:hypothetical protein